MTLAWSFQLVAYEWCFGQRVVVRQEIMIRERGKVCGERDKMDSKANGQAQTQSDTYKHARSHTYTWTHIYTPTLWFMQTELVSSRDLSSPEGLRGNQTEYLRQASLIPLVRLKSHAHTHKLYLGKEILKKTGYRYICLLAYICVCFSVCALLSFLYISTLGFPKQFYIWEKHKWEQVSIQKYAHSLQPFSKSNCDTHSFL